MLYEALKWGRNTDRMARYMQFSKRQMYNSLTVVNGFMQPISGCYKSILMFLLSNFVSFANGQFWNSIALCSLEQKHGDPIFLCGLCYWQHRLKTVGQNTKKWRNVIFFKASFFSITFFSVTDFFHVMLLKCHMSVIRKKNIFGYFYFSEIFSLKIFLRDS
jgi:hypothetical protein